MTLEITRVDCYVLKLLLHKQHFALMKNTTAELHHNAQVRKERDDAQTIPEKTLLLIDENTTSLHFHLLQLLDSKFLPNRTINTRHCVVLRWLLATHCIFGNTVVLYECLHSGTSLPHVSSLLSTTFEVGD